MEKNEKQLNQEFAKLYQDALVFLSKQTKSDVFEWNIRKGQVHILSTGAALVGFPPYLSFEDFRRRLLQTLKGAEHPEKLESMLENTQGMADTFCEMRVLDENGKIFWYRVSMSYLGGTPKAVTGIIENISHERSASLSYLIETQFYHALLTEKGAYGHVDVTDDRILLTGGLWNPYNEFKDSMSYSQIMETYIRRVVLQEDRDNYLDIMFVENLNRAYEHGIFKLNCEFRRFVEQNKMVWMELGIHLFKEPYSGHLMALMHITDINARKQQNLQLHYESQRDQLTNVYNKKIAESLAREYLKSAEETDISALMIVDLDNFKQINDTYGHKEGDNVLVHVAQSLEGTFRRSDIIGRFGGDEFIVFLKNIRTKKKIAECLEVLTQKLRQYAPPAITCSIGVKMAEYPGDYAALFELADKALYQAKLNGKAQYCFYEDIAEQTPSKQEAQQERAAAPAAALPARTEPETPIDTLLGIHGDMAYLTDPDSYELLCANQAFYDRIGLTPGECNKAKCYELMYHRASPCPFCTRANWSPDKFFIWKDNNWVLEQEFLIKNKLVPWGGKEALLTVAVDISNDKTIWDSIDNKVDTSHILLSGIQRMESGKTLNSAIWNMLDTIGYFFRADSVSFWESPSENAVYQCVCHWKKRPDTFLPGRCDLSAISSFFRKQPFNTSVIIESPEAMLSYSFELYQTMQESSTFNYRIIRIKDHDEDCGCLFVSNSKTNLQNKSFLESLTSFFVNELRKRRMLETILHASQYDSLTGVKNRNSYEMYLQDYNADDHASIGILVANIDNLKGVNATSGQLTGNSYIKRLALQLSEIFGEERCYRIDGDEFLVIADEIDRAELEEDIKLLNGRIATTEDFTVSLGHSWDNIEKNLPELMDTAIKMMRIHKKKHYDAGIAGANRELTRMRQELCEDLRRGKYQIYLQPKFNMETNTLIGAEALIRRLDSSGKIVPPSEFIPVLEKNNLIRYIDLFVLKQVCMLLERWKRSGITELVISLNFSRLTLLEEDIMQAVEGILSENDFLRSCLEIEVTESFAAGGKSTLYQITQELYHAGCNLSMDDFGIKYTNLSMLADIDFHTLKIDKSLIKALGDKESNQIILKNIIQLCRDLNINVIAEGVENREQQNILNHLGCLYGQGYLFGKPMPVEQFHQKYLSGRLL